MSDNDGQVFWTNSTNPALHHVTFCWHGGALIEFGLAGGDNWRPAGVCNVWDYERDVPTIERSAAGLAAYVAALSAEDVDAIVCEIVNA